MRINFNHYTKDTRNIISNNFKNIKEFSRISNIGVGLEKSLSGQIEHSAELALKVYNYLDSKNINAELINPYKPQKTIYHDLSIDIELLGGKIVVSKEVKLSPVVLSSIKGFEQNLDIRALKLYKYMIINGRSSAVKKNYMERYNELVYTRNKLINNILSYQKEYNLNDNTMAQILGLKNRTYKSFINGSAKSLANLPALVGRLNKHSEMTKPKNLFKYCSAYVALKDTLLKSLIDNKDKLLDSTVFVSRLKNTNSEKALRKLYFDYRNKSKFIQIINPYTTFDDINLMYILIVLDAFSNVNLGFKELGYSFSGRENIDYKNFETLEFILKLIGQKVPDESYMSFLKSRIDYVISKEILK